MSEANYVWHGVLLHNGKIVEEVLPFEMRHKHYATFREAWQDAQRYLVNAIDQDFVLSLERYGEERNYSDYKATIRVSEE